MDGEKRPDLNEICEIENSLISALRTVVNHGVFAKETDATELGGLVDMVKDLAETKRNYWEACYYETITNEMKEYDDDYERMGYNHQHYANGKFAPTGRGHYVSGYTPSHMMLMDHQDMMSPNVHFKEDGMNPHSKYGNSYSEYEDARRHYTESKTSEDKNRMDEKAMEHVQDSMMTLRDIWKNADPTIKKQVSAAINGLATEFKTA